MHMSANTQEMIVEILTRYGFQVLGALAVLVVGLLVARWLGGAADRRFQKTQMEPPMRILLVRVIRVIVLVMAVLVALDKFGFSVAPLVAGIGVAGLGAGLALQGVFSNLVAGLTIIFTKPFRVGEYIEINNVRGDVSTIELSTTLIQADLSRVVVPNRRIVGEILHNFGTMRQLTLTIRVPHTTDLNVALQAAHEVAVQSGRVLKDRRRARASSPSTTPGSRSRCGRGYAWSMWSPPSPSSTRLSWRPSAPAASAHRRPRTRSSFSNQLGRASIPGRLVGDSSSDRSRGTEARDEGRMLARASRHHHPDVPPVASHPCHRTGRSVLEPLGVYRREAIDILLG